ncbi:MAG: site-specific integrase [Lachnospiraceae bacterium]|nr:site-specific integrase [Ruminococcus sp.]MCM1275261.1 site-specific integrase [Lachnospiraceae bacterium]
MPIYKIDGEKKNGLQKYRVRVAYQDNNGKTKQVERTCYGLAESQMMEKQLLIDYRETKEGLIKSKMTVRELYDEYMAYHETETRKTSHVSTAAKLQKRVLPYLGECRLDKLTQQRLANWKIEISKQNLSLTTKKNGYTAFSALLNYAVKMGYLVKNPLSALGTFKDSNVIEEPSKKLNYYTPEQFLKFIEAAKSHCNTVKDWDYYVYFSILFYLGLRKGEATALKWSDIEGDTVHIRRSISQKLGGGDLETLPKNKSSIRDLQMPIPLIEILNAHKERQKAAAGEHFSEDYRICGGEIPLRDSSVENRNKKYASEANLPHIRIHDYRHSHASVLANNSINIQEVARRLGHADVQMTWNVYSHLYPQESQRAVNVLNLIVPK